MTQQETDEYIPNNAIEIPIEISDFGGLLKTLRNNHGYSLQKLSKMIGLPVSTISHIEMGKYELPAESVLRDWLTKLGCGRENTRKILTIAATYRVKHWIKLTPKETANADMIRLLSRYRNNELTDYDRALLKLIAR